MANKFGATLSVALKGSITDANATGFGAIASTLQWPFPATTFGDGNGSGNVNKLYQAKHTIGASTTLTLTLDNGSLTDALGAALTFGKLKAVAVYNSHASIDVTVGGANSYLSGGVKACAGGCVLVSNKAGVTVGSGSNNTITIANAGGSSVDVYVAIMGSAS